MKIIRINLVNLQNGEHFYYQKEFVDLVTEHGAGTLHIEAEFAAYMPLYLLEVATYKQHRKSSITREIANADIKRNVNFSGWVKAVKSALNHYEAPKQLAAQNLMLLVDHFKSLPRKPYNSKSTTVKTWIYQCRVVHAEPMAMLDLNGWVDEMEVRNNAFDALVNNRFDENEKKTNVNMKEARTAVDKAFRALLNRMEAFLLIDAEPDLEKFIHRMNVRSVDRRDKLAQRAGRAKAKKKKGDKNEDEEIAG
jgi:Family of unknown function (DUF6261)